MSRFRVSRRAVIRAAGLAGVSIALPPLDAMFDDNGEYYNAADAADAAVAKRLIAFHFPTGIYWADEYAQNFQPFFFPKQLGTGWPVPEGLSSLSDYKNDITILRGLTNLNLNINFGPPHFNAQNLFTGTRVVANTSGSDLSPAGAGGISFDQVAASALGSQTRFSSVGARLYNDNGDNAVWSWKGKQAPNTLESDPRELFKRLFNISTTPDTQESSARDKSMLDFVKGDLTRWKGKLGKRDQNRLEQHLESIRELEKSLGPVVLPTTCEAPTQPAAVSLTDDSQADTRSKLLVDLIVMAVKCDLTHVAFYSLGGDAQHDHTAGFLGYNWGNHTISHLWTPTQEVVTAEGTAAMKALTKWKISQFAKLIGGLKAIPEGAGTVLDSCALVCTSDMGDSSPHYFWDLPVIVAGGLGGMKGGRYLKYSCQSGVTTPVMNGTCSDMVGDRGNDYFNLPIANLWLTMLKAVGVNQSSFGNSTGTLPSLWI